MHLGQPASASGAFFTHAPARVRLAIAIVGILAPGPAKAQTFNKLSEVESVGGWTLLWDGTEAGKSDRLVSGATGEVNTWKIDGDALLDPNAPDADAYLFTKESYTSFELSFEWKLSTGGNSGVFPRQTIRSGRCHTFEYAILDDLSSHPDAAIMMKHPGEGAAYARRSATAYDLYPTTTDGVLISAGGKTVALDKPAPQWNQGVIFADGNHVEHFLNGKRVAAFEIGSEEWNARFARSKYPVEFGCKVETYAKAPTGLIAFQDHGENLRVWLRSLKIRPFTSGSRLPRPYIKYSEGPAGSGIFRILSPVTGAVIRYTVDGLTPNESSPVFPESLVVTQATTVKAILTRPRFAASEVSTGVHVPSATAAGGPTGKVALAAARNSLTIRNGAGSALDLEILALDGAKVGGAQVARHEKEQKVEGLKPGTYLVRMGAGSWTQSRLILIP